MFSSRVNVRSVSQKRDCLPVLFLMNEDESHVYCKDEACSAFLAGERAEMHNFNPPLLLRQELLKRTQIFFFFKEQLKFTA